MPNTCVLPEHPGKIIYVPAAGEATITVKPQAGGVGEFNMDGVVAVADGTTGLLTIPAVRLLQALSAGFLVIHGSSTQVLP